MAKVRLATHDDLPSLVALGAAMHAESPRYRDAAFSPDKLHNLLYRQIGKGGVLVAESEGKIVGAFAFAVVERFFSHEKIAIDLGIFVLPEHRKGAAFFKLLREYELCALKEGVVSVDLAVSAGVDDAGFVQMLLRRGYVVASMGLSKKVNHV